MNLASPKVSVGPEGSTGMSGCLTTLGHITPGFVQTTEKWVAGITETPRHLFTYFGATETLVILCDTKCYVVTTGVPVVKTPSTPFTTQPYSIWHGRTLIHSSVPVAVVNNYGIDSPKYYDGGGGLFITVTNAPSCRTFCGWVGRMLSGNVYVSATWYVNRLAWSAINNITDWTYTVSSGYLDLNDESDAIQRIETTSGNVVIILRRKSVWLGLPNSNVFNPMFSQFLSSKGIRAPNSVQKQGNTIFYMSDSDIYAIEGYAEPQSIGFNVRTDLFKLADPATISYSWSFIDSVNKLYYLVVRLLDSTWRAWIFNYEQGSWSMQDFSNIFALGEWYA